MFLEVHCAENKSESFLVNTDQIISAEENGKETWFKLTSGDWLFVWDSYEDIKKKLQER